MDELDFIEDSICDIIVPEASEIDLEAALRTSDANEKGEQPSLVPSIAQRQTLFFDETVNLYVVLRTSYVEEEALKRYLSRIAIRVEAHVVSLQSQPRQDGPAKQARDLIFSDTVKESEDPITVVQESDDNSDEENSGHLLVFWRLKAFLSHPRARISSRAIIFTVLATLLPATPGNGSTGQEQYLPSGVPAQSNLFEALQDDPSLQEAAPYLSASRVSRFTPSTNAAKGGPPLLRQHNKRTFSVVHAASARLRYSRLKSYEAKPTVLASLEFEVAPVRCDLRLEKVDLKLKRGVVEPLTTNSSLMVPLTCRPRDQIVLLYKFTPDEDLDTNTANTLHTEALEISIGAIALVSEDCRPHILMRWRTSVDFSTPLNPSYGGPSQLLQRPHRPSSLPVPTALGPASAPASTASSSARVSLNGPDATSSSSVEEGRYRANSIGGGGVTITFSGPQHVYVGEAFKWDVFVVNRSTKIRMLALLALPKSRAWSRRHISKSSASSSGGILEDDDAADAVVDENVLYATQKHAVIEPAGLVNLSSDDLRVGPLHPGACFTAELKFVALESGALPVDAVRVVDIGTNQTVYVRDLPDIVALPKATD